MNGPGRKKFAKRTTTKAMFEELSTKTGLTKKQVAGFFDALTEYISAQVGQKGPGIVAIPGLLKIKRVQKKATAARLGRNPISGETITIPAKPKRTVVKAQALKALKEMVK